MAKEKTAGFFFRMSPEEEALFHQRMEMTGIQNKSAFIRKMCIDGHVFRLDMPALDEIARLLRYTSNNMNQVAHRANCGEPVQRKDIAHLSDQLAEVRKQFGEVLESLAKLDSAMPSKRFIRPLKITDFEEGA